MVFIVLTKSAVSEQFGIPEPPGQKDTVLKPSSTDLLKTWAALNTHFFPVIGIYVRICQFRAAPQIRTTLKFVKSLNVLPLRDFTIFEMYVIDHKMIPEVLQQVRRIKNSKDFNSFDKE